MGGKSFILVSMELGERRHKEPDKIGASNGVVALEQASNGSVSSVSALDYALSCRY